MIRDTVVLVNRVEIEKKFWLGATFFKLFFTKNTCFLLKL